MTDLALNRVLAVELAELCGKTGSRIATAESCTGGMISAALTDIAGSSSWFECGFITYSNAAKQSMLGVRAETLEEFGAVSGETVLQMAEGALARSQATLAVAVSGVAGPGGGSAQKPVGTVFLAVRDASGYRCVRRLDLAGNRARVRLQTTEQALRELQRALVEKAKGSAG